MSRRDDRDSPQQTCALCLREVPRALITRHHLTPKQKGGKADDRVPLCRPCHKQLHAVFSNDQLAKEYRSIAALQSAEILQPFLKWIRKQKADRNFRTMISSAHPGSKRNRLSHRRRARR